MAVGTYIILVLVVVVIAILILMLLNQSKQRGPSGDAMTIMQQQLDGLRRETSESLSSTNRLLSQQTTDINFQLNQRLSGIERNLSETTGQVGQRLDSAVKVIRDVSATMGDLSRASQQILDVGKNISSLQDILRAPKLRGVVGELFLGNLLQQVVPHNYQMQYRFKTGEIVDAVVTLGSRLVPLDAKFPLENFQRLLAVTDDAERRTQRRKFLADVKKHIDTIAKKYILPDEGTFDFAMMYIPAENVYYEMIIREEGDEESLNTYAIARRVIPVSPGSLYAYLQAIVFGLRGMQVERRAQEILDHLGRLEADLGRFRAEFDQLGTHIGHAHGKFESADRLLARVEDKLALAPEGGKKPDELPGA